MVEGIEGVGEAVTGGMAARAVEPRAGEGAGHGTICLNCGEQLAGDFCHRCGQRGHVHRTLGAWWHDLAHGVLHLDGKVWRTLPLLAWKPGELTRRYVEGERARFVSPMALFLFSVFLMFAVFTLVGGPFNMGMDAEQFRNTRAEMAAALEAERKQLKELETERAEDLRQGETAEVAQADEDIREARETIRAMEGVVKVAGTDTSQIVGGITGWPAFDEKLKKVNANPALTLYKIQNNAYKFSWALIPISVPFVWLLFLHRRRYRQYRGYDHTVFVTYSIAFMSLGLIALSLFRVLGVSGGWLGLAALVIPPIHIYRQLRGAYLLSRWSALWRTFILVNFAFIAGGLFLTLLLALGVLG